MSRKRNTKMLPHNSTKRKGWWCSCCREIYQTGSRDTDRRLIEEGLRDVESPGEQADERHLMRTWDCEDRDRCTGCAACKPKDDNGGTL